MPVPERPKVYHIIHRDRLQSVMRDGHLWCDAEVIRRQSDGSTIGMNTIKERRLRTTFTCHPDLHPGDCVPFYFCPRSIMLFVIHCANHPELAYRGGQRPIVHLEADLYRTIEWAETNGRRWAFTLTNAGSYHFEDRADVNQLGELNWKAILSNDFRDPHMKEGKQAEFLVEHCFPWHLVERIGVHDPGFVQPVARTIEAAGVRPPILAMPYWYY